MFLHCYFLIHTFLLHHDKFMLVQVLKVVRKTLQDLHLAIEGTIIMSTSLKDMLDAMYDARVPERWRKVCVYTIDGCLSCYLYSRFTKVVKRMVRRVDFMYFLYLSYMYQDIMKKIFICCHSQWILLPSLSTLKQQSRKIRHAYTERHQGWLMVTTFQFPWCLPLHCWFHIQLLYNLEVTLLPCVATSIFFQIMELYHSLEYEYYWICSIGLF